MPILRAITQKLNVLRPRPHVAGSASSRGTALEALGVERAGILLRRNAGRGAREARHESTSASAGSSAVNDESQPAVPADVGLAPVSQVPTPAAFIPNAQQAEGTKQATESRPAERPRPALPRVRTSGPPRMPSAIGEPSAVPARLASTTAAAAAAEEGDWVLLSPQSPVPTSSSRPQSFAQRPLSGDWLELTPSPSVFPPSSGSRPPPIPPSLARVPNPSASASAAPPGDQRVRWPTAPSPLGAAPTAESPVGSGSGGRRRASAIPATREPRARTTAMAGLATTSAGSAPPAPAVVARVVQRTTSRPVPPRLPPPMQPPPPVPAAPEPVAEPASDHPYATATPLRNDSPPRTSTTLHVRPPPPLRHDSADSAEILAGMLAEFPMPPPLMMPKRNPGGKSGNMAYCYATAVHTPPMRLPSPPQGRCNI